MNRRVFGLLILVLVLTGVSAQEVSAPNRTLAQQTDARVQAKAGDAATIAAEVQHNTAQTMKTQGSQLRALSSEVDKKRLVILQQEYKRYAKTEGVPEDAGEHIYMFASKSMPDGEMRSLIEAAQADHRMILVFLGGEREGGVNALVRWLSQTAHGLGKLPHIEIDPPRFKKYNIARVPIAVIVKDGKEIGRVAGVYSSRWMDEHLASKHGDLGTYGQLYIPIEVDMEAYLKARVTAFDWTGYVDQAKATFWKNLKVASIPHASSNDSYRIDPTITITKDIRLPDGRYLAHAGDKVNPLDGRPLRTRMVVVDAADPMQRSFARDYLKKLGDAPVVVMSTSVPSSSTDGWATWAQWQDSIGAKLYFYSPAFAERLRLTGTPSIVSGDGRLLKVEQIKVD